ncbi:hybrid sensor histidine kinase/response regulator transcription factor [Parapedobacter soli]|uniref:hybrid sensor histidine kinase/response regulator transcription factor n=1 Tax=Parapedobacter soli TaxID=416955 RepID=UPI0021C879FE|nr:hybrid sensor histidine kinase/response regulator transcription factor [Parapedobacter soli]
MLRFCWIILAVAGYWGWYMPAAAQTLQFQQLDVDDGLSHNHITAIVKDERGFVWFGTPVGLNRYDAHEFKVFRHVPTQESSLVDNGINDLFLGPGGRLWVRTPLGVNIYDPGRESFIRRADSVLREMGMPGGDVLSIERDPHGRYWFLLANNTLYRYESQSDSVTAVLTPERPGLTTGVALGVDGDVWTVDDHGYVKRLDGQSLSVKWSQSLYPAGAATVADYQVFIDRDGRPWVYADNLPLGVFWWPDTQRIPRHLSTTSDGMRLNNMIVFNISQDIQGQLWIATDHGGVNLVDPQSERVTYLMHDEFDARSLKHNSVTALYNDGDGIMWVGTFKGGISYYHPHQIQFPVFQHHSGAPDGLPFDDINRFVEDSLGNVWIGTNGGGLLYFNRSTGQFTQYRNDPADPRSIGSDVIVSLFLDEDGTLWIGTYHGGLNRFDGKRFTRYLHDPADARSISDNSVWEIYRDSQGRLWVGTLSGGLNLMDKETETFTRPEVGDPGFTPAGYISAIREDHNGAVWFGTATGVERLSAQGDYSRYAYNPQDPRSLSNDYVTDIAEDSRQRLWVATREGLNLYDEATGTFHTFGVEDGLPDNTVLTILEDRQGTIWVSTAKGLSAIHESPADATRWRFRNYDRRDGLQATAFNENAALLLSTGELLFGGPAGFNIVDPLQIQHTASLAVPMLVDFQLFDRSIDVAEWRTKENITLSHDENVLGLVVASLQFLNKDRTTLRYQLEGFDDTWLSLDRQSRKATFTNLDPGTYRFRVMVSADGETWSEPYTLARITISPPFWKTAWAYLIYTALFVGAILTIRHIERTREKTRFALQQEREQARQIAALDQMKTRFFTNVSHEFRTPINLILAPLDKLMREASSEPTTRHLTVVQRNAKRLLNLVNQLLDFRKIDMQALKPNLEDGDIAAAIHLHFDAFTDLAESKHVRYRLSINETHYRVSFDHDKLERILFNLLSNAFKFTPAGGEITVEAVLGPMLTLTVSDTGIGIPPADRERIFDRYFQHDAPIGMLNRGNGIGLAITKEYIELLNGSIAVASTGDNGSTFTVKLPLVAQPRLSPEHPGTSSRQPDKAQKTGLKRVLLVDDDDDFRFYLKDNLRASFAVYEASDAATGWTQALALHPDIVVADVSMPGDDGIALCRRLKGDSRTRHIPVVLLTAMAEDSMQLAGIEAGATDYITKPFNFELLRSKLGSILKQQESMERTFKKRVDIQPMAKKVVSADERFMRKALEVVEEHMGDTDFTVELLADKMNVSRVGLYKRVLTLTGHSPSEFIRIARLRRAAQLLAQSGMTVAEVAYEVGFGSPKQFSKYFKALYNTSPSTYRKEA